MKEKEMYKEKLTKKAGRIHIQVIGQNKKIKTWTNGEKDKNRIKSKEIRMNEKGRMKRRKIDRQKEYKKNRNKEWKEGRKIYRRRLHAWIQTSEWNYPLFNPTGERWNETLQSRKR